MFVKIQFAVSSVVRPQTGITKKYHSFGIFYFSKKIQNYQISKIIYFIKKENYK
jgi:hypothetical protein